MITKIKKNVKRFLDNEVGRNMLEITDIDSDTKIVSFDIFDTLIVRDVNKPVDVFKIMETRLGIHDFYNKRIEAEKKAREKQENTDEVTIEDIYRSFDNMSEEDTLQMCKTELEIEKSLCHPNRDILPFYEKCLQKYRVIIVSDMYFPQEMMAELLTSCGITGYQKLYISCDIMKSKASAGELLKYVADNLGVKCSEITHIGNDFKADYLNAKRIDLKAIKVKTKAPDRLICEESREKYNDDETTQFNLIYSFINNTTDITDDFYYRFGYENFGVLLWGFCKWLIEELKSEHIEQVLFVARDGYIIKKVYDSMGYSEIVPSYYFEMSRRSAIVPSALSKGLSYDEMIKAVSLPARINIMQFFDAWGLEIEKYKDALLVCGIKENEIFWLSKLAEEVKIQKLYECLKKDIVQNAHDERNLYTEYIRQFHFEKKTALVDIGWAGTIQKQLISSLNDLEMNHNVFGYYLALDKRAQNNRDLDGFRAKGFLWDHLNNCDNSLEEGLFVGLFESFFLEQEGSVKKYLRNQDDIIAVRYKYEYLLPGEIVNEIECVRKVQLGAMTFVDRVKSSYINEMLINNGKNVFRFLRSCLVEPSREIVKRFGEFRFFDMGDYTYLAFPKRNMVGYLFHPKEFVADFYESQWPIGFLKSVILVPISYECLWGFLRVIKTMFEE